MVQIKHQHQALLTQQAAHLHAGVSVQLLQLLGAGLNETLLACVASACSGTSPFINCMEGPPRHQAAAVIICATPHGAPSLLFA